MPLFSFEGRVPSVSPEAWIAPTATLVGDVVVEAGASVWYGAVLRADFGRIVVRAGANVQDNSVLHGGAGGGRPRGGAGARRPGDGARPAQRGGRGVGRRQPVDLPGAGPAARGRR